MTGDLFSWALALGLLVAVFRWRAVNVSPRRENPARELDERYAAKLRHPSTGARRARHVRLVDRAPGPYDWNADE